MSATQQNLPELARELVEAAIKEHSLTDDERRWVRLAIAREARREAFQRAVIEKTLASLIWTGLAVLGYALWEYIKLKLATGPA